MATLHVRNVPDEIYERLKGLAEQSGRSLTTEVVGLLGAALQEREERLRLGASLERIRARRIKLPAGAPDSVKLIRQDRSR